MKTFQLTCFVYYIQTLIKFSINLSWHNRLASIVKIFNQLHTNVSLFYLYILN